MVDIPAFQSHHIIEQQAVGKSALLEALIELGLFKVGDQANLINLPRERTVAIKMGVSPHLGGPIKEYSNGLAFQLAELEKSPDGQLAMKGDKSAALRVAGEVSSLRNTMRSAIINGDLFTNFPDENLAEVTRAINDRFYKDPKSYASKHPVEIDRFDKGQFNGWDAATASEAKLKSALEAIEQTGYKGAKGAAEVAKLELGLAVAKARQSGRLVVSPTFAQKLDGTWEAQLLKEILSGKATVSSIQMPMVLTGLKILGLAGLFYDITTSTAEAANAVDKGDKAGAGNIMARLAGRIYLGMEGGAIGAAGGAAVGAALGAAGGPAALATSVVGALVGGVSGAILGDAAVDALWKAADDVVSLLQAGTQEAGVEAPLLQPSGKYYRGLIASGMPKDLADKLMRELNSEYKERRLQQPDVSAEALIESVIRDVRANQAIEPENEAGASVTTIRGGRYATTIINSGSGKIESINEIETGKPVSSVFHNNLGKKTGEVVFSADGSTTEKSYDPDGNRIERSFSPQGEVVREQFYIASMNLTLDSQIVSQKKEVLIRLANQARARQQFGKAEANQRTASQRLQAATEYFDRTQQALQVSEREMSSLIIRVRDANGKYTYRTRIATVEDKFNLERLRSITAGARAERDRLQSQYSLADQTFQQATNLMNEADEKLKYAEAELKREENFQLPMVGSANVPQQMPGPAALGDTRSINVKSTDDWSKDLAELRREMAQAGRERAAAPGERDVGSAEADLDITTFLQDLQALNDANDNLSSDIDAFTSALTEKIARAQTDTDSQTAAAKAAAAKAEVERQAAVKVEAERQAAAKAEAERQAAVKAEAERQAAAKAEAERQAAAKAEAERQAAAKAEAERQATAKAEAERQAAVKAEAERQAAAKAEAERQAAVKAEAERQAAVKAEAERQAAAKAEAERQAAVKAEAERQAAAKAEAERQAAAKAEAERQAAAKAEAERQAAAKAEAERARIASEEARKAQELQLQRYNERMRQEEQSRRERDERQRQWNLQQQREAEQRRQQAAADQARRDAERERLNREAEQRVFENLRRQQTFSNLPSSPTIFRPPGRLEINVPYNPKIGITGNERWYYGGSRIRPVAFDLNGDALLEMLLLSDGVDRDIYTVAGVRHGSTAHFDSDGNGILDNTAWIGPNDGILAIDLGKSEATGPDGIISRPEEIAFSMWKSEEERVAELKAQGIDDTGRPVTDLEGLRFAFDTNQDDILDNRDARWSEFRIWQDFNQNGSSDEGELSTLEAEGIAFIDLMPRGEGAKLFPDGSMITGTSSAKRIDGTSILVGDVALAYRPQT
ncbi:AHH domain-containing protein [Agrobacterium salinitolerans]|uniref:AHH domain-containing protein n=1 Tax=Agrobacterium salinitolerans TaxID=1183413 RepID=A0A9X3QYA8_9HYPH|nr:AHH domain-containing protein [Agrobacterium salinitolerans]MCZ7854042.1 AHH domain-containing protein [Agrobacterium salinitolerans]MCZ7891806.1 AHH domain-containing protein [Agrobacterium salinitolerans]MCZ7937446.1 AHH domain-containing protein [Agrobacterium salinitolerans]MCZ7975527.1 AHH domain-containing protein [Agrobacterium salinitolerans]